MYKVIVFEPTEVGRFLEREFDDEDMEMLVEYVKSVGHEERPASKCLVGVSSGTWDDHNNGRSVKVALRGDRWALICFQMKDSFPNEQWMSVGSGEDEEVY